MNNLFGFLLLGGSNTSSSGATGTQAGGSSFTFIILLVVMFAVMYFVSIRPQKKKQKEEQQMRDNLQIGDEVTTIGGILGRVVAVKEDSIVIETGADRNKMKITRWAIQTNNTATEKAEAERAAAKEAAEKAKAEKKGGHAADTAKDEPVDESAPVRKRFGKKKDDSAEE
ncbi:MAG: preprotein translocase subunit YajC [Clostridia bacterium]|nr:preprotein translocase subunit YajC [Clostridia bacterium]